MTSPRSSAPPTNRDARGRSRAATTPGRATSATAAARRLRRSPVMPRPRPCCPAVVSAVLLRPGQTMRKQGSCLEKLEIMQGTMPGARRRGRPRREWKIKPMNLLKRRHSTGVVVMHDGGNYTRRLRPSSENVRSLSLAQQLAAHYRMAFVKSQTPIHLSVV